MPTAEDLQLEPAGPRAYVARFRQGEDQCEVEIRLPESLPAPLTATGASAEHLARATILFLLTHQLGIDLPPIVEVDDVIAAYDTFIPSLG